VVVAVPACCSRWSNDRPLQCDVLLLVPQALTGTFVRRGLGEACVVFFGVGSRSNPGLQHLIGCDSGSFLRLSTELTNAPTARDPGNVGARHILMGLVELPYGGTLSRNRTFVSGCAIPPLAMWARKASRHAPPPDPPANILARPAALKQKTFSGLFSLA